MKVDLKLSEKNVEHRIRMLNLVKKVVELRKKVAVDLCQYSRHKKFNFFLTTRLHHVQPVGLSN